MRKISSIKISVIKFICHISGRTARVPACDPPVPHASPLAIFSFRNRDGCGTGATETDAVRCRATVRRCRLPGCPARVDFRMKSPLKNANEDVCGTSEVTSITGAGLDSSDVRPVNSHPPVLTSKSARRRTNNNTKPPVVVPFVRVVPVAVGGAAVFRIVDPRTPAQHSEVPAPHLPLL